SRIAANGVFALNIFGMKRAMPIARENTALLVVVLLLLIVLFVVMIWSTLAMQVKRRHDRGKSWPWLFVGFIPIIGPFWVLIECCCLEGTPGYNRFDEPSKTAAATFA